MQDEKQTPVADTSAAEQPTQPVAEQVAEPAAETVAQDEAAAEETAGGEGAE